MGKQLDRLGRKFPLTLTALGITGLALIVSLQNPSNLEQVEFIALTNLVTFLFETIKEPSSSKKDKDEAEENKETKL